MIKNILVGYDDSRPAQVALAQAIDLAEATSGRVRLVVVRTEEGPAPEPELAAEPGIVDMVDVGLDDEELEAESAGAPPFVEEARMKLAAADVGGSIRVANGGQPAVCLREEADLADLLVVGRGRARGGGQVGRTTRNLLKGHLPCPLLICASQYLPITSLLLVYWPGQPGGRAVSVAGGLAATLNIDLNTVVTAPGRLAPRRERARVESALLAYHTEGEVVATAEASAQAALSAGLERNPSILILPKASPPLWSWQLPALYSTALELPDTLLLIVP